jgi:hypothetical protein
MLHLNAQLVLVVLAALLLPMPASTAHPYSDLSP